MSFMYIQQLWHCRESWSCREAPLGLWAMILATRFILATQMTKCIEMSFFPGDQWDLEIDLIWSRFKYLKHLHDQTAGWDGAVCQSQQPPCLCSPGLPWLLQWCKANSAQAHNNQKMFQAWNSGHWLIREHSCRLWNVSNILQHSKPCSRFVCSSFGQW